MQFFLEKLIVQKKLFLRLCASNYFEAWASEYLCNEKLVKQPGSNWCGNASEIFLSLMSSIQLLGNYYNKLIDTLMKLHEE